MGFWDFLKGSKTQQRKLELSLDEVPAFVEKTVAGKRQELDETIAKKFSEIKFVLRQMEISLNELKKQPLESENAKLKKIVGTAREQAITRLSSLLEKLQPPPQNELAAIKQYSLEGRKMLQREIEQSGKSIAYTGIYLKESIKQLGQNVKELQQHFASLGEKMQEFSAVFLEKPLQESIEAVGEKSRAIASMEKEIEKAKAVLEDAEKKSTQLASRIGTLKNSDSFRAIASLQEKKASVMKEKQEKKTELVSLLSSIDKPLKRFSKAVESNRASLPGSMREPLRLLQRNPLQLLRKDPKGEAVKEILVELKKAIESGIIELKEKEKAKKLSTIDELLTFNFFSGIFWKFNELDGQLNSIEKGLKENPAAMEISKLGQSLKETEKLTQEAGFSLEALKGKLEKEREALSSLRQRIEEILQEMSEASVFLK